MTDDTEATEPTDDNVATATDEQVEESSVESATATAPVGKQNEEVSTPEFPDLKPTSVPVGPPGELNRLFDVQVTVAAELGRTSVPIQKLLGLTEGSVFELDRSISSPIELVAQGVPLGNGEVVVVDDSFAIRIKEIYANPS